MMLNSYVVSASVTNATVSHLEIPVMVTLRHLQNKEVCVDTINQFTNIIAPIMELFEHTLVN